MEFTLDFKYQIVLLDPGSTGRATTLRHTLEKRFRELELDPAESAVFLDASTFASRDPKAPVTGVYFGGKTQRLSDTQAIESLLAIPAEVFPVVENLDSYPSLVPKALWPINGLKLKAEDKGLEEIANLVLQALSLLRHTRRLFISYRRKESRVVAVQLYALFDERGYEVFLDTHGVGAGEPFQEVLLHKLADSDLMIMLDTPGFFESEWTKQELNFAATILIGILQVIWPSHQRKQESHGADALYLEHSDFTATRKRLRKIVLPQIATAAESLRARALAARRDSLVREVCLAALELGIETTFQPHRYIHARKAETTVAIIPAIGIPTAQQIHEFESRFQSDRPSKIALVYDHRGIRDRWLTHLKWLDLHLPIKSFRMSEARNWLAGL